MTRLPVALWAGVLAALATGCASEALLAPGAMTSERAAVAAGAGSAYDTGANGAATRDSVPSPFSDVPASAAGGREVIEKPTRSDVMLAGPLAEMSFGRADAPVTLVKYASLTCPHCRRFQLDVYPELKRSYIDTGKVRFILREFPIGRASGTATIALRCADPGKYLDLYGRYLTQQASWVSQEVRTDAIFAVAAQVGMRRAEFDACLQNQGMIEGLKWVKERGRKLGVIGTPNFFLDGRLIKSTLGWKELRELIEASLAGPAADTATAPVR